MYNNMNTGLSYLFPYAVAQLPTSDGRDPKLDCPTISRFNFMAPTLLFSSFLLSSNTTQIINHQARRRTSRSSTYAGPHLPPQFFTAWCPISPWQLVIYSPSYAMPLSTSSRIFLSTPSSCSEAKPTNLSCIHNLKPLPPLWSIYLFRFIFC